MRTVIHATEGRIWGKKGTSLEVARGHVELTAEQGITVNVPISVNSTTRDGGKTWGDLWLGVTEARMENGRPSNFSPIVKGAEGFLKQNTNATELYNLCVNAGDMVQLTLERNDKGDYEEVAERRKLERVDNKLISAKAAVAMKKAQEKKAQEEKEAKTNADTKSALAEKAAAAKQK